MHTTYSVHDFSFWNMWQPPVILVSILFIVIYFALIGPLRSRFTDSTPVSKAQKTFFILGIITFYLGAGSPLSMLGHKYLFSAHMTQMALHYLCMPPLLLLGTPAWLIKPLFRNQLFDKIFGFLTKPLIAIVTFNAFFSFYHVPFVFDTMMLYPLLGSMYSALLVITSFMMWWPIVSPFEEVRNRLHPLLKVAYMFTDGLLMTPACALIIFAKGHVLFQTYVDAPQLFSMLPPRDDEQLGGVIMKLFQEVAYGAAILYIFIQWKLNNKDSKIDSLEEVAEEMAIAQRPLRES